MTSNATRVSFSVQSKSNRKQSKTVHCQEHEDQPSKHFVTEFDPNQTLTYSRPKPRLILPPKANESRPHKKMKNIDLSNEASDQLQLELHSTIECAEGGADRMTYGLNLRRGVGGNKDEEQAAESVAAFEPVERVKSKDVKFGLDGLPEDEGFEQYEDMPVEDFGAALLAGLGWYEGRGLGKSPNGNVQIEQIEKKSFVSDVAIDGLMSSTEKRIEKESIDANGGDRKDNPFKHARQESEDTDRENINGSQKHRESEKRGSINNGSERSSRKGEKRGTSNDGSKKRSRESVKRVSNGDEERLSWLKRHIIVKIISKQFKKGRFFLKKGEVVDVAGTSCNISMDDGRELIKGIDQDLLETALPRSKGRVVVLYGKHKGVYGTLVDREMDRNTGVVFDGDTEEYLNVKLDQIAEYTRGPSSLEY